jgi:hypothetical protein
MASLSITNTFTAGDEALASEVNQNFTDVRTFVNSQVVHKDGTNLPFTVTPTISSTNANAITLANHLANKAYVDYKVSDKASLSLTPKGLVAVGTDTSLHSAVTASADISANLALALTYGSWPLEGGKRQLRISAQVAVESTSGAGEARLYVYKNTVLFAQIARLSLDDAGDNHGSLTGFALDDIQSGTQVYSLRLDTTGGDVAVRGDVMPATILIEDMGPA